MSESTDLIVIAKTWIQAPKDSTPIEFEEVWDLDGSTEKSNAKKRFLQVKEHLINYGLATEIEFREILLNPGQQGGRPTTTYLMSYNVFKHYISSSQTERGYRTRAELHQAEEELQAIKADPMLLLGDAIKPITGAIETLAQGFNSLAGVVTTLVDRMDVLEQKVNQPQLEVRKPLRLMMGKNKFTAQTMADYIAGYGLASFGLMVSNAYRQHFGRNPYRWGSTRNSECAYSDSEFAVITDLLMERLRDANVRIHKKHKRLRKNSKPAEGQQQLFDDLGSKN
jgi:hypothetical protein